MTEEDLVELFDGFINTQKTKLDQYQINGRDKAIEVQKDFVASLIAIRDQINKN